MNEYLIKIVIIGDKNTGKSSLLKNYKDNHNNQTLPTIGVDFITSSINNIKLHIWDTSGSKSFFNLIRLYFKTCCGFIITFRLDDITSFLSIENWINHILTESQSYKHFVFIATHTDNERNVPKELILQICNKYNTICFEINAKLCTGINEVFNELTNRILSDYAKNPNWFNNLEGFKDCKPKKTIQTNDYILFDDNIQDNKSICEKISHNLCAIS